MFKFFRSEGSQAGAEATSSGENRAQRRSSGLAEFTKLISSEENLCILDLGPTSPKNIALLTGMGHRIYNEDVLLSSLDPSVVKKMKMGPPALMLTTF